MEQATLTEFFSAKKRPIDGLHPAKRRKVEQTESVRVTRQKTRRAESKSTTKGGRRASSRSISTTPANLPEVPQTAALDAFLTAEMKLSPKEPIRVTEQVTSVDDDHESIGFSLKESTTTKRARKTVQKTKLASKSGESCVKERKSSSEKNVSSLGSLEENKKTRAEKIQSTRRRKQETATSNVNDSTVKKLEAKEEVKSNIMTPSKSPVKTTSSSGMKINPWIADQANRVLLSRGQAALLLSQQKSSAVSKEIISSKQRPKAVSKDGLSKTKAQEGLGKARELIMKMRSLESDASKSKVSTTIDASERLHKLAKRKSNEGVLAQSSAR